MAEPDAQSLDELFAGEPSRPSAAEAATWVDIYSRLTDLLARQAVETRELAASVPKNMRGYLDGENLQMLNTELDAFRERLAYWRGIASASGSAEQA